MTPAISAPWVPPKAGMAMGRGCTSARFTSTVTSARAGSVRAMAVIAQSSDSKRRGSQLGKVRASVIVRTPPGR